MCHIRSKTLPAGIIATEPPPQEESQASKGCPLRCYRRLYCSVSGTRTSTITSSGELHGGDRRAVYVKRLAFRCYEMTSHKIQPPHQAPGEKEANEQKEEVQEEKGKERHSSEIRFFESLNPGFDFRIPGP